MADKIDAAWLFSALEIQDNLVPFPVVALGEGLPLSVITQSGVLFIREDKGEFLIGAKVSEEGYKTLMGFQVEPAMKVFDTDRCRALVARLKAAHQEAERNFFNKKALQEVQRIEVWRSLGSAMTSGIKNAAAWLDDVVNENADKIVDETRHRIDRIRHIMDEILEDGVKRKRRILL